MKKVSEIKVNFSDKVVNVINDLNDNVTFESNTADKSALKGVRDAYDKARNEYQAAKFDYMMKDNIMRSFQREIMRSALYDLAMQYYHKSETAANCLEWVDSHDMTLGTEIAFSIASAERNARNVFQKYVDAHDAKDKVIKRRTSKAERVAALREKAAKALEEAAKLESEE